MKIAEKPHEEMITASGSIYTEDIGDNDMLLTSMHELDLWDYIGHFNERVKARFRYHSDENGRWETPESLRFLLQEELEADLEE